MNVMIIPEDCTWDGAILKPIVTRMFQSLGRHANVSVCLEPRMGGVEEALRWERVAEVIDDYRHQVHLFLLIVDRDGKPGRRKRLDDLEAWANERLAGTRSRLIAENAWQEIEVWLLAAMNDLPKEWKWKAVRAHPHPKEAFFEPYVQRRGLSQRQHGGRVALAEEAAKNYKRIRSKCSEIKALEARL